MEQSWNNAANKSLHFTAFAQKHCSIDLRFSFARGAPATTEDSSGDKDTDRRQKLGARSPRA